MIMFPWSLTLESDIVIIVIDINANMPTLVK